MGHFENTLTRNHTMQKLEITPLSKIVERLKLTGKYSEIPQQAVDFVKAHCENAFSKIGYRFENIQNYAAIPEFMARYELANVNAEQVETLSDDQPYKKVYEEHLKGKRFQNPKGLLLFGACGTGKTLAARIIANRFNATLIDTYRIAFAYLRKDGNDWVADFLETHSRSLLIIDDVGAEGDIRKFGNESPIGAIISTRARHWELYGTPTIYTTNFADPEELAALYGKDKRLLDRLSSYQVGVKFTGASLRQ